MTVTKILSFFNQIMYFTYRDSPAQFKYCIQGQETDNNLTKIYVKVQPFPTTNRARHNEW